MSEKLALVVNSISKKKTRSLHCVSHLLSVVSWVSSTSGDSLEAIYIHRIPTSTIYSVCTSLSNIITTPQNHFRTTLSHISLFQRRLTMEHCPTNITSSVICHSQWAIWSPIPSSIWFYLSHCNTIYVGYPNALSQSRQRSSTPLSNTTSGACQKKVPPLPRIRKIQQLRVSDTCSLPSKPTYHSSAWYGRDYTLPTSYDLFALA